MSGSLGGRTNVARGVVPPSALPKLGIAQVGTPGDFGTWAALTGMPGAYSGSSYDTALVLGGVLYVTDDVRLAGYNISGLSWAPLDTMTLTSGNTGGLCAKGSDLVFVGDQATSLYTVSGDSWDAGTTLAIMSTPRFLFGHCQIGTTFYAMAGWLSPSGVRTAVCEAYDISGDSWSSLTSAPHAGQCRAVVCGSDIWAFILDSGGTLNVCSYDVGGDSWTDETVMTATVNTEMSGSVTSAIIAGLDATRVLLCSGNSQDAWILNISTGIITAQTDPVPGDTKAVAGTSESDALILCAEDFAPSNVWPLARFTLD